MRAPHPSHNESPSHLVLSWRDARMPESQPADPQRNNEHTDPHIVAGWRHPAELEPALRPDGSRDFRTLNVLCTCQARLPVLAAVAGLAGACCCGVQLWLGRVTGTKGGRLIGCWWISVRTGWLRRGSGQRAIRSPPVSRPNYAADAKQVVARLIEDTGFVPRRPRRYRQMRDIGSPRRPGAVYGERTPRCGRRPRGRRGLRRPPDPVHTPVLLGRRSSPTGVSGLRVRRGRTVEHEDFQIMSGSAE